MTKMTRHTESAMFAEDVVAAEYARLGFWRRLMLRWVSKDMHHAARYLAANPRGLVNVPLVDRRGPFDTLASDLFDARKVGGRRT